MSSSIAEAPSLKRVLMDSNGVSASNPKKPSIKKAKKTAAVLAVPDGPPLTTKQVEDKITYATRSELNALLKKIFDKHPEIADQVLAGHRTDNEPVKPLPDDPLLKACFHCNSTKNLSPWFDLMACNSCNQSTFDKTTLCSWFGFSKKEADNMKRSSSYTGMYRGIKYCYQATTVRAAVKKRDGSLFEWLLDHEWEAKIDRETANATGKKLQAATNKAERKKVIAHALKYTKNLDHLLRFAVKQNLALKHSTSLLAAFVPKKVLAMEE